MNQETTFVHHCAYASSINPGKVVLRRAWGILGTDLKPLSSDHVTVSVDPDDAEEMAEYMCMSMCMGRWDDALDGGSSVALMKNPKGYDCMIWIKDIGREDEGIFDWLAPGTKKDVGPEDGDEHPDWEHCLIRQLRRAAEEARGMKAKEERR